MELDSAKLLSYCPDCGPASVPHWVERSSVRMDEVLGYLTKPMELIWRGVKPLVAKMRVGRIAPTLARSAAAIGLGTIAAKPDEKNNWRARVLWEEAERRGIDMREFRPFGLSRELFFATYRKGPTHDTIGFDGLPRPRTARENSLSWMDDKGIIIERFQNAGIPMPKGKTCSTAKQA